MKWYQLDKKYSVNYLLLSLLSFLYIFPITLVNVYFMDDLGWSLHGGVGFKGDGRPLSEYLVLILCGGEPVTDTAPLPLILGALFLSYALILYAKTNLDFVSNRCALLAMLLFMITNPFLVECLFYRYGSMGVLASLGMPFLIFSIPDTTSSIKLFIYSSILSIAMMSLQQVAIGVCLILFMVNIFLMLFQNNKSNKRNYVRELLRIIGIGTGAIIYKAIVVPHYVTQSDWRYTASQTLEIKPDSIIMIFQNIADTCKFIMGFLSETAWWYQITLAILLISAVLLSIFLYCRDNKKSGGHKILNIAFLILSPAFVFVFSFLALMILRDQTLKLRIFTSLGGCLLYLGILLFYFTKNHLVLIRPLLLLLVVCNLYHYTYVYSFANAVNNQNEYEKYLVYQIAHDLETINADGEFTMLTFIGSMPQPQRTQLFTDKYPMSGGLLPRYFNNDGWRGGAYVLHYLQDDLELDGDTDADRAFVSSEEPVLANSLYACYTNGDKIIVAFRETEPSTP